MTFVLFLLLGTHIYFTYHTGCIQRKLPQAIRLSLSGVSSNRQNSSAFSALATALAATIGTGNIIGVSTAVAVGGPGAVFWCWLTGLLGIATCYAECYLSVKYHVQCADGSFRGGPMYVLEHRLHQKGAAVLFSLAVIFASFGMGCGVQARSVTTAVTEQVNVFSEERIGLVLAMVTSVVILGGAKQISKICTWLVPFMSLFYFVGCLMLIWLNRGVLFETLLVIVRSAFASKSVLGGCAGTAVTIGMRVGISRGLFTNEAGLGSVPIAAASSGEKNVSKQALVSMTGPFWDTVVMCAVTGIALVSCMVKQPDFYANAAGERWCFLAFAQLPFFGDEILSVSLILFAFATIIGWSYYGNCAVQYLVGQKGILVYQIFYIIAVYFGAVTSLEVIWGISDLLNVAMAVPNLCCLWMLRKEVSGCS